MRHQLIAAVLAFVITPITAEAAIRYEFQQISKSEPATEKPRVVVGSVFLDHGMSRVDYSTSSSVGGGTWVISRNGGRDTIYVDPGTRTYYSHSRGELRDALAGVELEVTNLKIHTESLGSGPIIAGYPTDRHRLTATYDVSIALGEVPLVQHVQTVIDKWTTPAFGDTGREYFRGSVPSTGDPEIDRLIEAETMEVEGFPLRQTMVITTRLSEANVPRSSQLQIERSRRQSTELLVTKIGRAESDPTLFQIPHGFRPIEDASLAAGSGNFQSITPSQPQ